QATTVVGITLNGGTITSGNNIPTLTLGGDLTATYNSSSVTPTSTIASTVNLALSASRNLLVNAGTGVGSNADLTINSIVSGATSGLVKFGTGTVFLTGANTFSSTSGG